MAIVTVTPASLSLNAATACDIEDMTTEHAELECDDFSKLLVYIENEDTVAMTATFKAGDFSDNCLGDLGVSIAASTHKVIGPFDSSRFKDEDGKLTIETSSTGTLDGKIQAFILP